MFDRSSKHRPLTLLNFVQINHKNRDTYTMTKKNTTPIKPPNKIGRSNENRPLKEGVKYYFTDLCLKISEIYGKSAALTPDKSKLSQKWFKVVPKMPQSWIQLVVRMSPSRLKVFIPNTVTNTKLIWLFLISIAVHNKDKRINIPCFHLVFTLAFFGTPSEVSWKG